MKLTPNESETKVISYIYNRTLLETGSQDMTIIKATAVAYGLGMMAGERAARELFS